MISLEVKLFNCVHIYLPLIYLKYTTGGIENDKYPGELKTARVVALYKKGVKYDPIKYRPISLLSHFDKILKRIICRGLVSFLERNKILFCYQYGFRILLRFKKNTDFIKRVLYEKHYVIRIIMDFKKAFDTVDHEMSLYRLECYGIRRLANEFFRSYLTNRLQYTVINGVDSDRMNYLSIIVIRIKLFSCNYFKSTL